MRWRCSMSPLCRCSFITTSFSQTNIHAYPWHLYKFELGGAKSVKSSPRRCYCLGEFLRCHQQDRLGSSRHSHSATAFREGIESGRVDFIWPFDWKGGSCHVLRCFQFFCYLCLKGVMWEQQEGVLHLVWEWCLHIKFLAVTKSHCVPNLQIMMWICSPCELEWNSFALTSTDIDMSLDLLLSIEPLEAPSANGDTQSYAAGFLEGALTHTRSASETREFFMWLLRICTCDMETLIRWVVHILCFHIFFGLGEHATILALIDESWRNPPY